MMEPPKEIKPDFAEMTRLASLASELDKRIASLEARLFLTDDFNELWSREVALEGLYAERRKIGEDLIKASTIHRTKIQG